MNEGRCRNCAALVKPGAHWCSLCFADLREKDRVETLASVGAPPAVRRGRHARREPVPIAHSTQDVGIDVLLSSAPQLGMGAGLLVSTPRARIAIMVGGMLGSMLVFFGLLWLFGSLL